MNEVCSRMSACLAFVVAAAARRACRLLVCVSLASNPFGFRPGRVQGRRASHELSADDPRRYEAGR